MKLTKITIKLNKNSISRTLKFLEKYSVHILLIILSAISIFYFWFYLKNGLGLSYNDARSHLDIGRRVVEGLKPGIAQLGSVWLPLSHILMIPLVWNDWMWHSGFAGAIWNMVAFVGTGYFVYKFLEKLKVGILGRIFGVIIFAANLNILYLQSTAMTEPLLLATITAGAYYLMLWAKEENILDLIKSAFWTMLSTMVRYDGWFFLLFSTLIIAVIVFKKKGYKTTEGVVILFVTLAAFGVALWFLWNLLIFKDPLYFLFGPFSAHTQQQQMLSAGDLPTKGNMLLSTKIIIYSLMYNLYSLPVIFGSLGAILFWLDKKLKGGVKAAASVLLSSFVFNVLALFFGFSVVFVQGISGDTWFNIRYGILLGPTIAIFCGYLVERLKDLRWVIIGLSIFVLIIAFTSVDAVTIDDARVGSSQKNVSEVSGWLNKNAKDNNGFILISAASHDAIIFSSGLPMKRFIHEGTGLYWESALAVPDKWARYIVMRTYDDNDLTYKNVKLAPGFKKYILVDSYPFADIYQLKDEYLNELNTEPIFGKQK
jgi:hypothetical protein